MIRYLDTGRNEQESFLATWLIQNIEPDILGFHVQFGYYDFAAFQPFAIPIREAGESGCSIHFVLGSNARFLTKYDVEKTLDIVKDLSDGSLTVVAFSNALFHPKVVAIQRSDESFSCLVGSGNLTAPGLGRNVEAFIEIDTRESEKENPIAEVLAAIAYWRTPPLPAGAFPVYSTSSIESLLREKIISETRTLSEPTEYGQSKRESSKSSPLPSRRAAWLPPKPEAGRKSRTKKTVKRKPASAAPKSKEGERVALQWHKKLSPSDAQVTGQGTAHTGNLRLSKSEQNIDHKTWFRETFFGEVDWKEETRQGGKIYEIAEIEFSVYVAGKYFGQKKLLVDHAEHRIAGQGNVPTFLKWGRELTKMLREGSYEGRYVFLEKRNDGSFCLRIDPQR